jgi:hypothetical protein
LVGGEGRQRRPVTLHLHFEAKALILQLLEL